MATPVREDLKPKSLPISFFEDDAPHGLAKRVILKKYLQSWIPRMFYTDNRKICYFDGFAGAGVYGATEEESFKDKSNEPIENYGSPIIALLALIQYFKEISPDHESIGFNRSAMLILVEDKKENYIKLINNVKECLSYNIFLKYRYRKKVYFGFTILNCDPYEPIDPSFQKDGEIRVIIIHESFQSVLPNLFHKPTHVPKFSFLDPFGYSQTPMRHVLSLLASDKDELMINMMVQFVNRFHSKETCQQHINDLFGCQHWARIYDDENTAKIGKCAALVSQYESHLSSNTTQPSTTLSFGMKSKINTDIYSLVFATSQRSGVRAMKEAMNRVTQEEKTFKFTFSDYIVKKDGEIKPWRNDQDPEGPVADFIFGEFSGRHDVPLLEIEEAVTLSKKNFIFRKKSLKFLEKKGKIVCVWSQYFPEWKRRFGTFTSEHDKNPLITFRNSTDMDRLQNRIENEQTIASFLFESFAGKKDILLVDIKRKLTSNQYGTSLLKKSLKFLEEKKYVKVRFVEDFSGWKRRLGTFPEDKNPLITFCYFNALEKFEETK